ncbi:MAG: hypothetical protein ABIH08_08225 [Candidatus Omnitrophota bacterium]
MRIKSAFLTLFFLIALSGLSFAASLEEILNEPNKFDGKVVEIEGEVIGNPLKGAGGIWINIKSEDYNMGIFSEDIKILEKIKYWGSYKEKGDYLAVEGVFYKHCPQHQIGGLHLKSLKVIERGHKNEVGVSKSKVKLTIIIFMICLALGLVYFIKRFLEGTRNL